tara:strand:- start:18 stop:437 length:420 start_codon:yes stop_codon:yes gene_type:complete
MSKEYITIAGSQIFTQSKAMAKEVLGIVKKAGYKRSVVSTFSGLYSDQYASTSPTEKRLVQVRYAPDDTLGSVNSDNSLVSSVDVLMVLLKAGWEMPHHAVIGEKEYVICREIAEEELEEYSSEKQTTPEEYEETEDPS